MDGTTLAGLDPTIQCAVLRLSSPTPTFERIGATLGISKQAAEKRFKKGLRYLQAFSPRQSRVVAEGPADAEAERRAPDRDDALIAHLRRQLVLAGVEAQLLRFFPYIPQFDSVDFPGAASRYNGLR